MDEVKNVIELKNVTKDYGDFKLDNVSFAVPEGTVCGFIGQNGAGKTTTINLILDVIKRDSGEITLFGESVGKDTAYLREDIGVVFDEMGFHEFMTWLIHMKRSWLFMIFIWLKIFLKKTKSINKYLLYY